MGDRDSDVWAAADRVVVVRQGVRVEYFYCSAWCLMHSEFVKASACRTGSVCIFIDADAAVLAGTLCSYCGAVCAAEYVPR